MVDLFRPITDAPPWHGEELSGKRIVVCPEQGWGDQIMWGRYLPCLREMGADVVVVCHPKIARLFERLGFTTRPALTDRPLPDGDYWTHFGQLPTLIHANRLPLAAYLSIPPGRGGGIGIVPTGNPSHFNDANRSLPPNDAARLLALGRDLRPEATGLYDFSDTGDLIANMDLVITVDTAMAHLAGSMGKACWVLLPRVGMDWRWGDGVTSPWYPELRLYRQEEAGNWADVLSRVAEDLTKACS